MKLERMVRLRELCIKNDWFTHGGNCSYDKMLTAFGERTASAQEIAAMIWVNSDTDFNDKQHHREDTWHRRTA